MSRRYRRKRSVYSVQSLLVLIVVLSVVLGHAFRDEAPSTSLEPGPYQVERVVDGDTLLLTNQARIRLLGVDTPETVKKNHPVEPWGPEASRFTREFVGGGKIRLEFDRERKDRYDRFLAYVWVGDRMLNEELLRAGLGKFLPQYPYAASKKRLFRKAEQEAKETCRGIWSE